MFEIFLSIMEITDIIFFVSSLNSNSNSFLSTKSFGSLMKSDTPFNVGHLFPACCSSFNEENPESFWYFETLRSYCVNFTTKQFITSVCTTTKKKKKQQNSLQLTCFSNKLSQWGIPVSVFFNELKPTLKDGGKSTL